MGASWHAHTREKWEREAPPRLARADVAALRRLYDEALLDYRDSRSRIAAALRPTAAPRHMRTVFPASRDSKERSILKLGASVPAISVSCYWSFMREWGLNVAVTSHARIGHARDHTLEIYRHRFRHSASQAEFCRILGRQCRIAVAAALDLRERFGDEPTT